MFLHVRGFLWEDIEAPDIWYLKIVFWCLLVTVKEHITWKWLAKAKSRVHIAIIRLSDKVKRFKGVKITPGWDVVCCDEQGVFLMCFIQYPWQAVTD